MGFNSKNRTAQAGTHHTQPTSKTSELTNRQFLRSLETLIDGFYGSKEVEFSVRYGCCDRVCVSACAGQVSKHGRGRRSQHLRTYECCVQEVACLSVHTCVCGQSMPWAAAGAARTLLVV